MLLEGEGLAQTYATALALALNAPSKAGNASSMPIVECCIGSFSMSGICQQLERCLRLILARLATLLAAGRCQTIPLISVELWSKTVAMYNRPALKPATINRYCSGKTAVSPDLAQK